MKKTLFGVFVLASSTAYAAPTPYGWGYTGILYEPSTTTTTDLTTNVSTPEKKQEVVVKQPTLRIGLKGSEDINETLNVNYKLEYGTGYDSKKLNLKPRDTYVGIKHKTYGELRAGRMLTSDAAIDEVNVGYLYGTGHSAPFSFDTQRVDNALLYKSPKFNGDNTQITLQYALADKAGKALFENRDWVNKSYIEVKSNVGSVGVTHKMDKTTLSANYMQAGKNFKVVRGVVSSELNDKLSVGVMAQATNYFASSPKSAVEKGVLASANYQYSEPLGVFVQAGYGVNYGGHPDGKIMVGSFGTTYDYTKNIKLFASVSGADTTEVDHAFDDTTKLYKNEKEHTKSLSAETGVYFKF